MDQTPTQSQAGRARSDSGSHWFIWAPVFLLFAYPLSTGPAFKLVDAGVMPESVLGVVYAPLALLTHHCKPLENFFRWYIGDLWHCKTH